MNQTISDKRVQIGRWIARGWGVFSFMLIGAFFIGELFAPASASPQGIEWLLLLLFPTGVLLGIALGWWWELWGGVIAVVSILLFYLVEFVSSGDFAGGPYFLLVAAPGFLFLWCGIVNCRSTQPSSLDA